MPSNFRVVLVLAAGAFAMAFCEEESSVRAVDKVRREFLEKYAKGPSLSWLKQKAVDARKKKLTQHKHTSIQEPSDVKQQVKALEESGANVTATTASILAQNKPLSDFLYEGDLLLTEAEAIRLNFTTPLKQRRAGGTITFTSGHKMEMPKWPHSTPICYRFEPNSDAFTMLLARKAFQFWTENSCLTWQEGCVSEPTIKIATNDNNGCFTIPGRHYPGGVQIQTTTYSDGTKEDTLIPVFKGEQPMSLSAPGCSWFKTATHEASHVMGMRHEQSRPDRNRSIEVIWSNIEDDWKAQYGEQLTSKTFGIPYDYGSNMQYTGYANDPKIDMLAKDKRYQHTMGNVVGPIFNDIKFVNLYNDCMCKKVVKCENGGFPHPRDCSKCICPEGFGGQMCTERQQGSGGAPLSCGQTINASPTWQTAHVHVPAPKGVGPYDNHEADKISIYAACCHYWIKGNGKRVMLEFENVTPGSKYECTNSCTFGATEVKFEDLTRGGARVCCPQHAQEFGTVVSASDLVIVRVCSLRDTQSAAIRFRTVDRYGPPVSRVVTSQSTGNGPPYSGGGGAPKPRPPPKQECKDEETFCYIANSDPYLCREGDLAEAMQENCRKSCGLC